MSVTLYFDFLQGVWRQNNKMTPVRRMGGQLVLYFTFVNWINTNFLVYYLA